MRAIPGASFRPFEDEPRARRARHYDAAREREEPAGDERTAHAGEYYPGSLRVTAGVWGHFLRAPFKMREPGLPVNEEDPSG